MTLRLFCIGAVLALLATSCKKDDNPEYNTSLAGDLSVEFDNVAGSSDLELNTGQYTNASNESLTITKLKYYVSNFVLTNANGTVYTVPPDSCYFLIDESDEESHEPVLHIPEGEYRSVTFTVGVDSLKSAAATTPPTGVLDPTADGGDMYRDLNSGYIFYKMEGTSPASTASDHVFSYAIGGYGGYFTKTFNNLHTVTLDLTTRGTPKVKSTKLTNIHLFVDALQLFSGTNTISIAAHPTVGFEDFSTTVAANISGMFRHDHTEN